MVETAIKIDDILKVLNWSRAKFYRRKQELLKDGAIFYQKSGYSTQRSKKIMAFETTLRRWIAKQAQKGIII
jgi:hypothetical protein